MNDLPQAGQESVEVVWKRLSSFLKRELGEATFSSWLGPVSLRETPEVLYIVANTGVARDWIHRHAWPRVIDLWAKNDPQNRRLTLTSRAELDPSNPSKETVMTDVQPAGSDGLAHQTPFTLRRGHTFENFAVGPANQFAVQTGRRIGQGLPIADIVLITGIASVGKTHLLQAIAHEYGTVISPTAWAYLDMDDVNSPHKRQMALERIVANPPLLLIDDVEYYCVEKANEDLRYAISLRLKRGGHTVFAGDFSNLSSDTLNDAFMAHIRSGVTCTIEPPDRDLRLAILRKHLLLVPQQEAALLIGDRVLELVSSLFVGSTREMLGMLRTLVSRCEGSSCPMAVDEAKELLTETFPKLSRKVTVDEIQKAVCAYYGLKQMDLISERRARAVARPRQVAMWICKQVTARSLPDIGRRFGGRDHTTVLHAVRRIDQLRIDDPQILRDCEALIRIFRG
ncbi:MAG: dnaA [Parcubacteria group bacterium]|nr:dnaA [Parcubacteria group bacterium]